tara:strand:+ start:187 stop:339 length:153 start_codon:yes stop_codon:yes gene_type:complete
MPVVYSPTMADRMNSGGGQQSFRATHSFINQHIEESIESNEHSDPNLNII